MNFLQAMGLGGVSGLSGMSGMVLGGGIVGGVALLLGSRMAAGGPQSAGGFPAVSNLMSQFFSQQSSGLSSNMEDMISQFGNRPRFQRDETQSPHEQLDALKAFALKNGSKDGTPVADWTSTQEEIDAGEFLTDLNEKQQMETIEEIRRAPVEERQLLQVEDDKLQELIKKRAEEGRPMTGREKVEYQHNFMERLYAEGKINDRLGQSNRRSIETQHYLEQTSANMFLKSGLPVPTDTPQWAVENSPYNRHKQQAV